MQYSLTTKKGLTKRTLFGIVLFKLDTIFSHVFSMKTGFLSTDYKYSRVPGDQEGLIFFRLQDIFSALAFVQIGLLQFVVYCSAFAKYVTPGHL